MKRIMAAGIVSLAVTVFFTGCSSLVGSMEVDYQEIQTSVAAEVVTDEYGENRLGITGETKKAPDYFQQNMTMKFQDLGGKTAFQIKPGHSKEADDIEAFQIADLKNDKTFIYGYVTRVEDGGSPRQIVHCAAFYNYASGAFRVFHENAFRREWENEKEESAAGQADGKESFFVQVCGLGGDIFVYDNGHGYLYNSGGVMKFHGDIESFIRKQFRDAYDVSVVNAVTDGQNRIYLEVSIEKKAINVPQLETKDLELSRDKPMDDEPEKLDQELKEKAESRILVYEYKQVNSGMDQENESFESQKKAWISQTKGNEYEEAPDGVAGWNQVLAEHPDQWGNAWLGSFDNLKVYRWKGETAFSSEKGVTSFLPVPGSYVNFRDVKEQWELENLFIPWKGKYSQLFGKTRNFIYYDPQEIKRQYTYVWYEEVEVGGADGTSTKQEKHSETRTQTLSGIKRKRYAPLQNAYIEVYWVMDQDKAVALGKCIDGEIQCTGKDDKVRWIRLGGDLLDTPYKVTEDTQAGVFKDGGVVYYVEFGKSAMAIVQDAAHGGNKKETPQKILYGKLAGGYEKGNSAYDMMLKEKYEEDLPEVEQMYGIDYYTEEQVLHADLNLNLAIAAQLRSRGAEGICKLAMGGITQGFLLTSQDKGLIFYAPSIEASAVLESGCWFGTWKIGNQYVSVGFLKEDRAYSGQDVAFARVYEYDLSTLCNESMKASLKDMEAKEAEEISRRLQEASRSAEESASQEDEDDEGIRSPLDQWNEEVKEKYSRE